MQEEKRDHEKIEQTEDDDLPPTEPPTIDQLLPALVELASIQLDLMKRIEFASTMSSSRSREAARVETGELQQRARRVLRWLLIRSGRRW